MLSLTKYILISTAAAACVVYHAFATRHQYFPAMFYLSTSKISIAIMGNLGFALVLCSYRLMTKLFLGSLREAEIELINDRLSQAVMETCLALTVFQKEFNVEFVSMFVVLFLIKVFHWLVQDRVDYIETTPTVSRLQHFRIISFTAILLAVDCAFLQHTVARTLKQSDSVHLLFAFEYVILASAVVSALVKYGLSMVDNYLEGRWQNKGVYIFYLELLTNMLHLLVYVVFFLIVLNHYGLPIHLMRDLWHNVRNLCTRVNDFLRYRRVTSNMDQRFPDATAEELARCDNTCIICREEMTEGGRNKKLPCGHVFHMHCLRSWLERQQNCPTCRSSVFGQRNAPEGGAAAAAAAQEAAPPPQQQQQQRQAAGQQQQQQQAGGYAPAQQQAQVGGHPFPGPYGMHPAMGAHLHPQAQMRFRGRAAGADQPAAAAGGPAAAPPASASQSATTAAGQQSASGGSTRDQPSGSGPAAAGTASQQAQVQQPHPAGPHMQWPASYGMLWNMPQWVPTTSMALYVPTPGYPLQYASQQSPQNAVPEAIPSQGLGGVVPLIPIMFPPLAPAVPPLFPPPPPAQAPSGTPEQQQQQQHHHHAAATAAAAAAAAAAASLMSPYGQMLMPPATIETGSEDRTIAAVNASAAAAAATMLHTPGGVSLQSSPEVVEQVLQRHMDVLRSQMEHFGFRQQQPPSTDTTATTAAATATTAQVPATSNTTAAGTGDTEAATEAAGKQLDKGKQVAEGPAPVPEVPSSEGAKESLGGAPEGPLAEEEGPLDEQEAIRRKRLQRFGA